MVTPEDARKQLQADFDAHTCKRRKKQFVKWGDQLAKRFTLSTGKHRIAVVANDKFIGSAKTIVNVTVP
jgi:hypothetical protein